MDFNDDGFVKAEENRTNDALGNIRLIAQVGANSFQNPFFDGGNRAPGGQGHVLGLREYLKSGGVFSFIRPLYVGRVVSVSGQQGLNVFSLGHDFFLHLPHNSASFFQRRSHGEVDLHGEFSLMHFGQQFRAERASDEHRGGNANQS